jgi:hypothetical protein
VYVALGIQRAMRLNRIICGLPDFEIFFYIYRKRHDCRKNVIEPKVCVLFPIKLLSEEFLILKRNKWDVVKYVYWYSCIVPFILVRI